MENSSTSPTGAVPGADRGPLTTSAGALDRSARSDRRHPVPGTPMTHNVWRNRGPKRWPARLVN
jgi:hypothetical protein